MLDVDVTPRAAAQIETASARGQVPPATKIYGAFTPRGLGTTSITARLMRGVGRHQSDGVNYSLNPEIAEVYMSQKLTMVYWKGDKLWLGKVLETPEIMTQGESVEELEENLKDAFRLQPASKVLFYQLLGL